MIFRPARPAHDGMRLGLWLLFPGACQWRAGRRDQGFALATTYLTALLAALLAWGTWLSYALLGLAFASHLASACDGFARRQFPGFVRGVPAGSLALALALGYLPLLVWSFRVASPACCGIDSAQRFLIDRTAFERQPPRPGDWVAFQLPGRAGLRMGRILAIGEEEFAYQEHPRAPMHSQAGSRGSLSYQLKVPQGFALVEPGAGGADASADRGLLLVPVAQVSGRAWAQIAPLRDWRWL